MMDLGTHAGIPIVVASVLGLSGAAWGQCMSDNPPPVVEITGLVRDFSVTHPDMESQPAAGESRWTSAVEPAPDPATNKPVLVENHATGGIKKIAEQWKDYQSRTICPCMPEVTDYDPGPPEYWPDDPGTFAAAPTDGGIASEASFNEWFNNVQSVNVGIPLVLTLVLDEAAGMYVFDDQEDPYYSSLGGFFPIDNQLFGNEGDTHNWYFTFELHTSFTYCEADAPTFQFHGDGDLYIFINDRLVTDIGGVHAAHDHFVDITRPGLAPWLDIEDGETYRMDIYFAERSKPQSAFRIETNVVLHTAEIPSVTAAFD